MTPRHERSVADFQQTPREHFLSEAHGGPACLQQSVFGGLKLYCSPKQTSDPKTWSTAPRRTPCNPSYAQTPLTRRAAPVCLLLPASESRQHNQLSRRPKPLSRE
jgi:hypothetical protein